MKRLIIAAFLAAVLATALTGCVDNTSDGGLSGAPYNNSGMGGDSDGGSAGENYTDDSGDKNDGTWSAGDDGFVDSDNS